MLTRLLLVCLVCVLGISFTLADDADVKKAAKKHFDEAQNALLKGDYDKFVAVNHPKVIESMGGKEKMAAYLAKETKKMKADGYEFKSVRTGTPSDPIRVGNEIYLTIPSTLEITVPGGRLLTDSTGIGLSTDGGKTWVIVNAVKEREQLIKVLPDLPTALALPKLVPPTFIKD
jgi:hypothetical protein